MRAAALGLCLAVAAIACGEKSEPARWPARLPAACFPLREGMQWTYSARRERGEEHEIVVAIKAGPIRLYGKQWFAMAATPWGSACEWVAWHDGQVYAFGAGYDPREMKPLIMPQGVVREAAEGYSEACVVEDDGYGNHAVFAPGVGLVYFNQHGSQGSLFSAQLQKGP